jgi:3-methyladenine DNA glycosylase AlkD
LASVPDNRARAKPIVRSGRASPRGLAVTAVKALPRDEHLAYEIFRACPPAVLALTPGEIEAMLPSLHDWKSVDGFACFVSGVAWREGVLTDRAVLAWTRDESVWVRRAALVSTVPLNLAARGATNPDGEPAKTLAVCARLVDDHEDMIVKALSWALRELARRDARAVRDFLRTHDDALAARVKRETRNKLTTGLKNPRRATAARRLKRVHHA